MQKKIIKYTRLEERPSEARLGSPPGEVCAAHQKRKKIKITLLRYKRANSRSKWRAQFIKDFPTTIKRMGTFGETLVSQQINGLLLYGNGILSNGYGIIQ
jgi:hypothetical protein